MLKTFITEVKQEVASRAGKTHNPLIGLGAAVTVRCGQVHLITKGKVQIMSLYKIFTMQNAAKIGSPTFDSRCLCHSSLDRKCRAHTAQAKSSEGHPLRLMVGSQGE